MHIALLNHSTYFAQAAKAGVLALIALAVDHQLREHVAPTYGQVPCTIAYYSAAQQVPASARPLGIFDDADQAGALGYHDVDPQGVPYGKVFTGVMLENGATDFSGDNSISCTISHEACEMAGDPDVNLWCQTRTGQLTVKELCDAVEDNSYPISVGGTASDGTPASATVSVSNFVTPNYFRAVPVTGEKFDFLSKLPSGFPAMTPGGYVSTMAPGASGQLTDRKEHAEPPVLQVTYGPEYPEWKKAGKAHAASRTHRRAAAMGALPVAA